MRVYNSDEDNDSIYDELQKLRRIVSVLSVVVFCLLVGGLLSVFWLIRGNFQGLVRQAEVSYGTDILSEQIASYDASYHSILDRLDDISYVSADDLDLLQSEIDSLSDRIALLDENLALLGDAFNGLVDNLNESHASVIVRDDYEEPDALVPSSYSGFMEVWGKVPQSILDEIIAEYDKVPSNIRDAFVSEGWKVIIIDGSIDSEDMPDENSAIGGVTMYQKKVIYLTTLNPKCILHEMGHFLDYKNGFCSLLFPVDVYDRECPVLAVMNETHAANYANTIEYFAECFYLWVDRHEDFCQACPDTAFFIEDHLYFD